MFQISYWYELVLFFVIVIPLAIIVVQSLIDRSINKFKQTEYEIKIKELECKIEKLEKRDRD
ncbi:hypothetical protein [Bacillus sp. FJAT-45350]|uniref:hypothetical protein n=1 Tax=Bacillus sp. FJAT-45350 TaxID=2011014 RepID=UPI000BB9A3BB|nr:hypothetical protein [Bacillus sp. FJAT-45350]